MESILDDLLGPSLSLANSVPPPPLAAAATEKVVVEAVPAAGEDELGAAGVPQRSGEEVEQQQQQQQTMDDDDAAESLQQPTAAAAAAAYKVVSSSSRRVESATADAVSRAMKFYKNGEAYISQGEYYSAMLNYAMAASTLIEMRNYNYDSVVDSIRLRSMTTAAGGDDGGGGITVSEAITVCLQKIKKLQTMIVEIRSGALGGSSSSSSGDGSSSSNEFSSAAESEVESLVLSWTPQVCRGACFNRIIGLEDAKQKVLDSFVYPLLYPNLYGKMGKGLLLFGMPGTGKTLLARAIPAEIMHESQGQIEVVYIAPQGQDLKSKYMGESEAKIKALFETAHKLACRGSSDSGGKRKIALIFIDEIEAVASKRSNSSGGGASTETITVNALLQQMDGLSSYPNVAVIAATNKPYQLDDAILRRLQARVPIDLPNEDEIDQQLNMLLSKLVSDAVTLEDIDSQCSSSNKKKPPPQSSSSKKGGAAAAAAADGAAACLAEDYEHCSKGVSKNLWKQYESVYFSSFAKLPGGGTRAIATELHKKKFSGSDVDRFFQDCLRNSGKEALKTGLFFVGPKMSPTSQQRGFVSVVGFGAGSPWSELSTVVSRIKQFEETLSAEGGPVAAAAADGGSSGGNTPGEIVLAPSKHASAIDIVRIISGGESSTTMTVYRNIYSIVDESSGRAVTLSFLPTNPSPLFDDIFVQIDEGTNVQNPDPTTSKVLFLMSFEVAQQQQQQQLQQQQPPQAAASNYPPPGEDQFELMAAGPSGWLQQNQKQLAELIVPGRRDSVYAFLETTVANLRTAITSENSQIKQQDANTKEDWFYFRNLGNALMERIYRGWSTPRSALDNILRSGKYDMYVLVNGQDVYRLPAGDYLSTHYTALLTKNQLAAAATPAEAAASRSKALNLLESLKTSVSKVSSPSHSIYSLGGHPLVAPNMVNTLAKVGSITLQNRKNLEQQRSYNMAKNIRYINWSVSASSMLEMAQTEIQSISYNQKEYEKLEKYARGEPNSDDEENKGGDKEDN